MEILMGHFGSAVGWLVFVCEHPDFDYDDWSTARPLIPRQYTHRLQLWEQQHPGAFNQYKLAMQYVLNWREFDLQAYCDRSFDFGLPEPVHDFLVFLWEEMFPGEPWQCSFPDDVKVVWEGR